MTQTYTSPTINVEDGDITSHDTDTVASDINILNAECRWEGQLGETFDPHWNRTEQTMTIEPNTVSSVSTGAPSKPPGEFVRHLHRFRALDTANYDYTFRVTDLSTGTVVKRDEGSGVVSVGISVSNKYYTRYIDDKYDFSLNISHDSSSSKTVKHIVETRATELVEKTTDSANVTRDVSASFSGELAQGTYTDWKTLSGFEAGVNEFYHNIGGGGDAGFQFRYDWEYTYPEPLYQWRLGSRDGSTIYKVALADPSSSRLDYNHVRYIVGGTSYALDVVDPSDPDAIEWLRIGTQHGVVCPRAYQTESV